jgi:hypothetical protein
MPSHSFQRTVYTAEAIREHHGRDRVSPKRLEAEFADFLKSAGYLDAALLSEPSIRDAYVAEYSFDS